MFRVACMILLISSSSLFAQNIKWADLVESKIYKIDREIRLSYDKTSFVINANDDLKLLDFKPLPMINVFLAELKILSCADPSFASEMILVEVNQPGGEPVSVGMDMAKKCVLEIFLEKKDYSAVSVFR